MSKADLEVSWKGGYFIWITIATSENRWDKMEKHHPRKHCKIQVGDNDWNQAVVLGSSVRKV